MAANTKYTPAPTRDSFEDQQRYSQPPPSYQAEASSPVMGESRYEDDNLPDDFKVCGKLQVSILIGIAC